MRPWSFHEPFKTRMSRRRRTKTLEKAARSVKDSDEFVEHIFNIAHGFADHHELDSGPGTRGVRQSLRVMHKHAQALAEWLQRSGRRGAPEHEAVSAVARAMQQAGKPMGDLGSIRTWLEQTACACDDAQAQLEGKKMRNAPRFAAAALRATFEHHKLKMSHQASATKQSDAVKLLCAIAKDGGDPSMTWAQARQWLIQARTTP